MFRARYYLLLSVVLIIFMFLLISGCDTETEENFTLEIDVDGSGEVSGSGTYPEGKEVTVEAAPDERQEFVGWHKDGEKVSSDLNYQLEINQDTQLKAIFEDKENSEDEDNEIKYNKDIVQFECDNLKEVIQRKLNIEENITKVDMKKIEEILPQDMIPHV